SVESGIGIGAAVDVYPQRLRGGEAEVVIPIGRFGVLSEALGVARGAGDGVAVGVDAERGGRDGVRTLTVLEVPDLVGECDVVRVRRPDHPGLRGGGGVHRVEVIRDVDAAGAG